MLAIATYNSRSRLPLVKEPALGALVRGNKELATSFKMADELEEVCIFPMILVCSGTSRAKRTSEAP